MSGSHHPAIKLPAYLAELAWKHRSEATNPAQDISPALQQLLTAQAEVITKNFCPDQRGLQ